MAASCVKRISSSNHTDRRAQTYYTESVSVTASENEDEYDDYYDEEADVDNGQVFDARLQRASTFSNLVWDEDGTPRIGGSDSSLNSPHAYETPQYVSSSLVTSTPSTQAVERTPLLCKQSTSSALSGSCRPRVASDDSAGTVISPAALQRRISQLSRRSSQVSPAAKNIKYASGGQSSFGQTVSFLLSYFG